MKLVALVVLYFMWCVPMAAGLRGFTMLPSMRRRGLSPIRQVTQHSTPGDKSSLTASDRKVLALTASVGVAETGWINLQKIGLISWEAADGMCSGASVLCSEILNGPWSTAFGFPLSAFGMAAYAAVMALALAPSMPERQSQLGLLGVTLSMAVFSAYLLTILVFQIGSPCPWCLFSAFLSSLLCAFTWVRSGDVAQHFKLGLSTAAATVAACIVFFVASGTDIAIADARSYLEVAGSSSNVSRMSPPPLTEHSSERAVAIAKKLKEKRVKLYGAYWCSHCFEQKQRLGLEAMQHIPYYECAKDGENAKTSMCKEMKVPGYPTWEVNGKLYPGEMSLDELEAMADEQ